MPANDQPSAAGPTLPTTHEPARWARIGPLGVGLIALVIAIAFVGLRWSLAADRDVSKFIVAGTTFTDPDAVDPPIHVFENEGYDGQFYYRLALDPGATELEAVHGIRMDNELRVTRIAYPGLAFLASFGDADAVAWAMVVVNVLAVGVAAGAAAAFARQHGRVPMLGLLVVASSGLVMSSARDLCEPTMIAAIVVGVTLIDRRRWAWAALAWSVAALAHEQALIVVGAYAAVRLVAIARRRARPGPEDVPWALPGVCFVAWQLVRGASTGGLPILSSGDANITLPFVGLLPELLGWLTGDLAAQEVLVLPELALLAATVVVAFAAARALPAESRWLCWVLAATVAVAICFSRSIWTGPAELRQVVIVPTIAWLVIIAARRTPPQWLVAGTFAVWLAVVGLRVTAV